MKNDGEKRGMRGRECKDENKEKIYKRWNGLIKEAGTQTDINRQTYRKGGEPVGKLNKQIEKG